LPTVAADALVFDEVAESEPVPFLEAVPEAVEVAELPVELVVAVPTVVAEPADEPVGTVTTPVPVDDRPVDDKAPVPKVPAL
jgi:hypothetical protein